MSASPARIAANQANAKLSTGPKTPEGKEVSRANSLKHGLTGAGVVLPESDAVEVERLERALRDEMRPDGEAGGLLIRKLALMSVRTDRAGEQEMAATAARVRRVMAEFEAPEGIDARTAEWLRAEAGKIAWFDPSKEASLARKYEAAALRGFFRALKELRQLAKDSAKATAPETASKAKAKAETQASINRLASFLPAPVKPSPAPARPAPVAPKSVDPAPSSWNFAPSGAFEVPMTIGRAR